MQRFAVIGLGRFGQRLARNLAAAGHEVIAIDRSRQLIDEIRDDVTLAVSLDATDEKALREQGVHEMDAAIIGAGDDFEATALVTVTLKRLGVRRVISRAASVIQAQILSKIGADEVMNPEDESADRWTIQLAESHFVNRHELSPGISLVECSTPESWVGKTLIDLNPRSQWGIHVVAVKRTAELESEVISSENETSEEEPAQSAKTESTTSLQIPMPNQVLLASDGLVLMGPDAKLAELAGNA